MKTFLVICAVASVFGACVGAEDKPIKAVAVLTGDTIRGTVYFTRNGCGQPVLVDVNITGLTLGDHGFHIHERGDLSDGCASLGAHYNPDKVKTLSRQTKHKEIGDLIFKRKQLDHGAPKDEIRHVGDLGNIKADATGIAKTIFSDSLISLVGSRSVIGRGVIVHQDVDDLGKGGNPDSLKTGNAGARAACGVIGNLEDELPPDCESKDVSTASPNSANVISSAVVSVLPVIYFLLYKWN